MHMLIGQNSLRRLLGHNSGLNLSYKALDCMTAGQLAHGNQRLLKTLDASGDLVRMTYLLNSEQPALEEPNMDHISYHRVEPGNIQHTVVLAWPSWEQLHLSECAFWA